MKNIVLYAPPAAGKGTLCEFLINNYSYEVVSIGQVLRNARNPETEIGRKIIETQDKGILTPDDIVAEALKNELKKYQNSNIVIEGYPRNIEQAKLLDSILDDYIAINLSISREAAKRRTLGRITCKGCNKIYNIYDPNMTPKVENVCDNCGESLEIRTDDNENSFNVRYDVYEENSPQILEFYKNKNNLFIVSAERTLEEIFKDVTEILENVK